MKRFLAPALVTALLIVCVVVLVLALGSRQRHVTIWPDNPTRQPVPMEPGRFQDTQCAMTIDDLTQACQAVDGRGRTWFFDDVGCLALWLDRRRDRDEIVLWVHDAESGEWIDGRAAGYLLGGETVMGYGFVPYRDAPPGAVDFEQMLDMMVRGENLTDPYVRKAIREAR